MKLVIMISLLTSSIFANNIFEQNREYNCINTYSIQQGKEVAANPKEAEKRPFVFIIKDKQLVTTDNVSFDFKMQRGPMSSYSNEQYMLLLTRNLHLGLVPRAAKGSVQFFFSCK